MRKAIYAVEAAALSGRGGLPLAMLVAVLAIDGSTLTRRAVHWLGQSRVPHRASMVGNVSLENLRTDGFQGAWSVICGSVAPLAAVTAAVWHVSCTELTTDGITDDSFLGLRALLLAIFLWRAGTFDELARIHLESMAFADAVDHHKANRTRWKLGIARNDSDDARCAVATISADTQFWSPQRRRRPQTEPRSS